MSKLYLNKTQLAAEVEKCLQCPSKPCRQACPVKCSPCDFIAAVKHGKGKQAAELIAEQNPLGEVCGLICPDKFCVQACLRRHIDAPIRIPEVQAEIMRYARENKLLSTLPEAAFNGKKIAVVGLGPGGIGAVVELLKNGFAVTAFEKSDSVGGALNLIPPMRLPREIIAAEWGFWAQNSRLEVRLNTTVENYADLLQQGFAAVVMAVGEQKLRTLGIAGEDLAVDYVAYLQNQQKYATTGNVAIIGGGAVAVDCARSAKEFGAANVEMFVRRRLSDMRVTAAERQALLESQVDITTMTRVTKIAKSADTLTAYTCKTRFNAEGRLEDVSQSEIARGGFAQIVLALGSTRAEELTEADNVFYAGDFAEGGSTVVEALASGKRVAAKIAEQMLSKK